MNLFDFNNLNSLCAVDRSTVRAFLYGDCFLRGDLGGGVSDRDSCVVFGITYNRKDG